MATWEIWVDTGGTFTDALAVNPSSELLRLKILSSSLLRGYVTDVIDRTVHVALSWPVREDIYQGYQALIDGQQTKVVSASTENSCIQLEHLPQQIKTGTVIELYTGEESPVFAARLLTKTKIGDPFPPIRMKLGSTRGTNAILERKGTRTAFLVTKGFRDLLLIGNQQRPDLFALQVKKPDVYYSDVIEIDERISSKGDILRPLTVDTINNAIKKLHDSKCESVGIALLNSYRNSLHEKELSQALKSSGFKYVSASSELSSQIKILHRAETAVANAYLDPVIHNYLSNIRSALNNASIQVMASYGGLINSNSFKPKDSLLSGPAGGVAGAAMKAKESGLHKIITFDMGGTSTDVSLYDSRFDYRFDSTVGSLRIQSPSLAIETIAAGGGSICRGAKETITVGPESAGAQPGPACYGRGGPLTLTDVNLLLGRLYPEKFSIPLSINAAEKEFDRFCKQAKIPRNKSARTKALLSLLSIANEKMAGALRRVSTNLGYRPADYTLLSFGGAGGQHACALAEILGMSAILIPYDAGLLSAYGIGHARVQRFKEKLILAPFDKAVDEVTTAFRLLEKEASDELQSEGQSADSISIGERLLFMRFKGQESTIELKIENVEQLIDLQLMFRQRYEAIFGHWLEGQPIEIESIRVLAESYARSSPETPEIVSKHIAHPERHTSLITRGGVVKCGIYTWENLRAGAMIDGPALVISNNSSTVVDPGWRFTLHANRSALLDRKSILSAAETHSSAALLELFTNRFTFVAQEMGAILQRTSFSVNVKERLDFSCAVLDKKGFLVVNAPHIPVHLGSMGICVREVLKKVKIQPGDVIITNHPAFGGSHLPDVTLIKGVFIESELIGYVANRAHHAEIGGTRPGSMPADATTLAEEGVVITPTYLIRNYRANWDEIEKLFTTGPYPTRLWSENRADLNGALASVNLGEQLLKEMCSRYGVSAVTRQMKQLRKQSADVFHSSLRKFPSKKLAAIERLDDGSELRVAMKKSNGKLLIDFAGSSATHPGNLNATRAIVQSVVLYVIRVFINRPIPMNEGLLDHVRINVPQGLLSPDFSVLNPPAVVGGNTEVSQRLTDTLFKALGISACSQGTMNNFLFGNDSLGYYETICGGTGAGNGYDGSSAVHHHMTNTRITDPEILEARYPVRLERFEIRKGSGGSGKWRGGDGVTREMRFLEKMDLSILSQHRKEKPYGIKGGSDGKTGSQWIIDTDGIIEKLDGVDNATIHPGECVVIQTPGGGGFGRLNKGKKKDD